MWAGRQRGESPQPHQGLFSIVLGEARVNAGGVGGGREKGKQDEKGEAAQ